MKKLIFFFPFFLFANDLLNDLKQKELFFDKQKSIEKSKEVLKSWISPINLTYNYSKDNSLGEIKTTTKTFSISVNQPIFKSGAIYYSIRYAKDSKEFNLLNVELQKRELIKKALDLAFDYKINSLNKKIILLNIENAKIDVKKKKEAFLNGIEDSTSLNNAILNLNKLKLNLEELKANLNNLKYSFNNISNLQIDKINLPKFKLISKEEFINSNIDYLLQKKLKKVKKDLYKMQIGNELLSVNLQASLNWQDIEYSNNLQNKNRDFYKIGFNIVLPISFNALNKIEQTKLDYLKSNILIEDKKVALTNEYKSILSQIKLIEKKIAIYKQNIKIYNDLISSTKDSITLGNATLLDLTILKNSKKTNKFNIKILKLQKEKLLLNLYYKLLSYHM